MPYDYETAMKKLSEVEKNRIVCVYLNMTDTSSVDWVRAQNAFGSASVDAMKKGVQNALKKIENAGGKEGTEASPAKASPAKAGGRKRKAAATAGDGDDEEAAKTPKKRGRKPKSAATTPAKEDDDDTIKVKGEDDGDE